MSLPNSSLFPGHPCLLIVHHPDLISSLHLSVNTTVLTASVQTLQQVLRWHDKARVPSRGAGRRALGTLGAEILCFSNN